MIPFGRVTAVGASMSVTGSCRAYTRRVGAKQFVAPVSINKFTSYPTTKPGTYIKLLVDGILLAKIVAVLAVIYSCSLPSCNTFRKGHARPEFSFFHGMPS